MNSKFKHSPRFKKLVRSLSSLLGIYDSYSVVLSKYVDRIVVYSDDEIFSSTVIRLIVDWCVHFDLSFVFGSAHDGDHKVSIRIYEK